MILGSGLRVHMDQTLPTREFSLLIDPKTLTVLLDVSRESILQLITDLSLLTSPIKIRLFLPQGARITNSLFETAQTSLAHTTFTPANLGDNDARRALMDDALETTHARELCGLADALRVDGLVTSSDVLIACRHALYQHDLIRIVPISELADFVEICAHGHSVFWSVSSPLPLTQDIFYPLAHPKNSRLANWWNSKQTTVNDAELRSHLHSAILNRYPFILYARDMVRFFQIQKDFFTRRERWGRFGITLAYHVNAFYLLLWGMLEQLAVIGKYVTGLKVEERWCGIRSPRFWNEFGLKKPNLKRFVESPRTDEWITVMADFRHTAAHKTLPIPTQFLVKTDESEKPEEEILKLILAEDPEWATILDLAGSREAKEAIRDQLVFRWRVERMKPVADHTVFIKGVKGEYLRSPVISVDYDLMMLTAVMDAFLFGLFACSATEARG